MLISIIIPCYNAANYLKKCLKSALEQTYQKIEIICIENSSTDETWKILKQIKEDYPQLIIDRESKPGAPAARNKGLSLAKGEWIQFLDADDLLMPQKIEYQVSLINEKISFIVGDYYHLDNDIKRLRKFNKNQNYWVSLAKVELGSTCSNLFSKIWIEKIYGWDETLKSSQEYDLMFRLLQINQDIIFDNNPLTIINKTMGSITNSSANKIGNIMRRAQLLNRIRLHIKNEQFYLQEIEQALFDVIREMYLYDRSKSITMFKEYFNYKFSPTFSLSTSNRYIQIHKLIGFRFANALTNIVRIFKKI